MRGGLAAGAAETEFEDVPELALLVAFDGAVEGWYRGGYQIVGALDGDLVVRGDSTSTSWRRCLRKVSWTLWLAGCRGFAFGIG